MTYEPRPHLLRAGRNQFGYRNRPSLTGRLSVVTRSVVTRSVGIVRSVVIRIVVIVRSVVIRSTFIKSIVTRSNLVQG
jgi:hypothetical protein